MKKKKLSFIDASAMLSKNEMKAITAGSGSQCEDKDMACQYIVDPCCDGLICQVDNPVEGKGWCHPQS